MIIPEEDFEQLRKSEEDMWRPEVRFSREKMDALLDDSFVEFGSSSRIYNKRQTLDGQVQEFSAQLPLPDFTVRELAPSVALVTYRSIVINADRSKREALRSSVWIKKGTTWKIVFHQGTPVP
jgi:hypothetical protein